MPELPPRRRNIILPLSLAEKGGYVVRVECSYCRDRQRHYLPADLKQLFGDIDAYQVTRHMRCERCGNRDGLEASPRLPPAAERATMTLRRLVRIRVKKIPEWRDELPLEQ